MSKVMSKNEQIFALNFYKLRRMGKLQYPVPMDMSLKNLNKHYLNKIFPKMEENVTYVFHQVLMSTLFSMMGVECPEINQPREVVDFLDRYSVCRNLNDMHDIDIYKTSIDFLTAKKRNGKIYISNVLAVDGSQHNAYDESTDLEQIVRDAVKDAVFRELNITSLHFTMNALPCGVGEDGIYDVIENYCEQFI